VKRRGFPVQRSMRAEMNQVEKLRPPIHAWVIELPVERPRVQVKKEKKR